MNNTTLSSISDITTVSIIPTTIISSISSSLPTDTTTTTDSVFITTMQSTPLKVFQVITLSAIWVFTAVGNLMVCFVIRRSRRMQSTTNYFILSLAVGDLLVSILTIPLFLLSSVLEEWVYGQTACKLFMFLLWLTLGSGTFSLLSIGIDRLYTIVHPHTFKITKGVAKRMVACSWLAGVALSASSLHFAGQRSGSCSIFIPRNTPAVIFLLTTSALQFGFPLLILLFFYSRMGQRLRRPREPCRSSATVNVLPRGKLKTVRMLAFATAVHFAATTPFHVSAVWWALVDVSHVSISLHVFIMWIFFASGSARPGLYFMLNGNFRRGCKEVFCMSSMRCYRSNVYTVTTASSLAKRNHVGVINGGSGGNIAMTPRTPQTKMFENAEPVMEVDTFTRHHQDRCSNTYV